MKSIVYIGSIKIVVKELKVFFMPLNLTEVPPQSKMATRTI